MTRGDRQRIFTLNIAKLIIWAYQQGYGLTFGDAYRDPRAFGKFGERKEGTYGRRTSLHKKRLAVDFNLFIDGVFQTTSKAHRALGTYWESLHPDNSWGGDFNDGNHYSMRYRGYR